MLYKIVAVLLAVILALSCCAVPVSATITTVSYPDYKDYPANETGYKAYVKDVLTYGAVNVSATIANPFLFATEEVCDFFGIDVSASTEMLPQDIVGNAFSQYYKDPNYHKQYDNIVYTDGDLQLRMQSFTESPLKLDASNCIRPSYYDCYCYFRFELVLKGEVVETWYHCYTHSNYKMTFSDWEWTYNNEGYVSGFRYYYFCKALNGTDPISAGYAFDLDDYSSAGDNVDITVEVPIEHLYKDCPKVYITDTDNNTIQEFYYVYEGDKPTFVNTTNYNDKYTYNDNGQINYNNKNYYTYPVVDTHTDDQLAQLKNIVAMMLTIAAMALADDDVTDLSGVYLYMQQILSILTTSTNYEISSNNLLSQMLTVTTAIQKGMLTKTEIDGSIKMLHDILEIEDTQKQLEHIDYLLSLIASGGSSVTVVVNLEDLKKLTEEEQSYLDVLIALIETISTFIPFTVVQAQMTEIHNVIFTGQPARDITVNILGQNMTLLSVEFVDRISSTLSIVKSLLSVFILYAWLKLMRKKMVDI